MEQTLYIFNPENDMALACGDPYYMPPASARKMAADLSALPGWYAEDGATVLLASEEQVAWMEEATSVEGASVAAVLAKGDERRFAPAAVRWLSVNGEMPMEDGDAMGSIRPWGWNPSLVRRLRDAGLPGRLLPDSERMQAIRALSGRQTAVRVLQRLRERWKEDLSDTLSGAFSDTLSGAFSDTLSGAFSDTLSGTLSNVASIGGVDDASFASSEGEGRQVMASACRTALCGESFVLTTAAEVESFVEGRPKALLKAPWSGSGRGVQYTCGQVTSPLQGWVRHILHTQQAVVGEPFYDKVIDFAMEFRVEAPSVSSDLSSVSSDLSSASPELSSTPSDLSSASSASAPASYSAVRFVGYSWFETDARGIYKENWLASDAAIEARLAAYVPVEVLHRIRKELEEELEQALQGTYEGYLGVDMMVCRGSEAGSYALHPCVEINLRTNMGVVARRLYDNYICPASQGRYVIEYYPQPGEALQRHQVLQEAHPLVMEGGRLRSGYFSLTPVLEDTHYQAYGIVEEGGPFRSVMAHLP